MASIYELHIYNTQAPSKTYHMPYKLDSDREKFGKRADKTRRTRWRKVSQRPKGLRMSFGITNYPPENPAKSHSPSGSKSESMGPLCILNTYTSGWPALASPN